MEMARGINYRIARKIKDLETDEETKKFLLLMLGFELEHANEGMPRYTQEYLIEIERSVKKMRGG